MRYRKKSTRIAIAAVMTFGVVAWLVCYFLMLRLAFDAWPLWAFFLACGSSVIVTLSLAAWLDALQARRIG